MKNLVILGASRAGKSTLAREINKIYPNYHIISGDVIRDTFAVSLPQNNINANGGIGMKEDFSKFLGTLLNKQYHYNNGIYNYVLETCDVTVENSIKYFQNEDTVIIFLGYSKLNKKQAFENYRKYDKETDWSYKQSDEHMLNHAEEWIQKSKIFKADCEKYNVKYIDTSYNREKVLKNLMDELEEQLK